MEKLEKCVSLVERNCQGHGPMGRIAPGRTNATRKRWIKVQVIITLHGITLEIADGRRRIDFKW